MSKDTIYRQDAIKALDNAWINGTSLLDANEAIKQLHALPSADRPQEWIPIEQEKPKDGQKILACYEEGTILCTKYSSKHLVSWLAWMPLPKPWKGAADE